MAPGRKSWLLPALSSLLLGGGAIVYALVASRTAPNAPAEVLVEERKALEPLFAAPNFSYTDQRGATVTATSLRGAPYIANFIFTTCRTICPLLSVKMVQLQRRLANAPMRFVSFSVDPLHDTPKALAAFAEKWGAVDARWSLLATDEATLPATAIGFRITAAKNPQVDGVDPIIHSSVFLLVDAEGTVRGIYDSEHREEFSALLSDAASLAKVRLHAQQSGRSGEELYGAFSCAACHDDSTVAPSLRGLMGKSREMSDSSVLTADRAYIKESILVPNGKRVGGYTLMMPSYDGLMSASELDALVDYTASLPALANSAKEETATTAIDPVCGMDVRADSHALRASHHGHTYYFCSEACRGRFLKKPDAFTKK